MGILEWVIDFFVIPIANATKNMLEPIISRIDQNKILSDGTVAVENFLKTVGFKSDVFKAKSGITPEDAVKQSWYFDNKVEAAYMSSVSASVITEAVTLGQVDISTQGYLHTPAQNAAVTNAEMFRKAEFIEGVYPAVQRYYRAKFNAMIPEPYRLALASSKGLLPDGVYLGAMGENGLDEFWATVYKEQNYAYPSWDMLFELYWRKAIDDATFTQWMQRNGMPPQAIEAIKQLRELIPPASDLVTMVVREAFDPKFVTPAPDVFAENMAKKGFSRVWADRYWTMHWVPMPLGQAYDNLRRGYWTKEQFMDLLRIADVHPMWREDIYKVAFNPPSIRELGYGYDVGVYNEDDIAKYRRWGGLSEEDAKKATTAMVAYRTETERNAVRTELLYAYGRDDINETQLRARLTTLPTPAPAVELWVQRAKLYHERIKTPELITDYKIPTASEAAYAYENGERDEAWYINALKNLKWTDERIKLAVQRSNDDIAKTLEKALSPTGRELTITQLRNFYKFKRITRDDLKFGLKLIGYNPADAELIAQDMDDDIASELAPKRLSITEVNRLYEYSLLGMSILDVMKIVDVIIKSETTYSPTKGLLDYYISSNYSKDDSYRLVLWTIIDLNLSQLKTMYSKGWISSMEMYNALVGLGIPQDKANSIMMTVVKYTSPERTATEKELTKAEIIKGAKVGTLNIEQASELLQGIGYDSNEAMYLLMINAVVARSDPETYWEMRKVVEQAKKVVGQPSVDIPDELIHLELQQRKLKQQVDELKKPPVDEVKLGEVLVSLANVEAGMKKIIAKLNIK